jgi:hypothetical protein
MWLAGTNAHAEHAALVQANQCFSKALIMPLVLHGSSTGPALLHLELRGSHQVFAANARSCSKPLLYSGLRQALEYSVFYRS